MGKFSSCQSEVFSVFDSVAWKAEDVRTYPENFVVIDKDTEYIRVSIIASGKGINLKSSSGILIIDIFTSAGAGPSRSAEIADKLDSYLVGKSIKTNSGLTQFMESNLGAIEPDVANPTLAKTRYHIKFNYFGV